MRTRLMLRPGERGTKQLQRLYGDRLVCVRYRYDDRLGRRLKTVELIVDEVPWRRGFPEDRVVGVRIGTRETELRLAARGAGGKYDGARGLWLLPYGEARRLGLAERAVLRGLGEGI